MGTAQVRPIEQGIAHSMRGSIKNYNSAADSLTGYMQPAAGYHTLFTLDFVKNLLDYSLERNRDWHGLKVNRDSFKTRAFQFRLADLEYIFSGLADKYLQYYLSDVSIVCDAQSFGGWGVDEMNDILNLRMVWQCQGFIADAQPAVLAIGNSPTTQTSQPPSTTWSASGSTPVAASRSTSRTCSSRNSSSGRSRISRWSTSSWQTSTGRRSSICWAGTRLAAGSR